MEGSGLVKNIYGSCSGSRSPKNGRVLQIRNRNTDSSISYTFCKMPRKNTCNSLSSALTSFFLRKNWRDFSASSDRPCKREAFKSRLCPYIVVFQITFLTFSTRKTGERGMKNIQMVMRAGNAMLIPVRT
jgi:hypothetical protein